MNVYLVSKMVALYEGIGRFLHDEKCSDAWISGTKGGDLLPELGGRLCYMSFDTPRPGGNRAYIQHIKEVGHGSVLEHSVFGVVITGVSRSLTHELVRHRVGMSYSQLSQRYVVHASLVEPPLIAEIRAWADKTHDAADWRELLDEWGAHDAATRQSYIERTRCITAWLSANRPDLAGTDAKKAARQTARACLPNQTETKIMVTGNARAWRHFFEQRGSVHADTEIRALARLVLQTLYPHAPHLFGDYHVGNGVISTPYPKV